MSERERLAAELRPVAFAIAYRMLGGVAEAEDLVQEALLRLDAALAEGEEIASPRAEISDSLSTAFLALLERLTPEERAALLLHDVFDYGYGEVAEIVGKSEPNARQLATRARRRVAEGRPRFESSGERREELGARFFAAAGGLISAMTLEVAGDRVVGVNSVVNPEKLRHLGPVGDMRAMLRGGR